MNMTSPGGIPGCRDVIRTLQNIASRQAYLFVAGAGENNSLPIRHTAFDVYLLSVFLLDGLVAFALLAPNVG